MTPTDTLEGVRRVLRDAARSETGHPCMLSSYQALHRLPEGVRGRLLEEHGRPGSGAGGHRAAAHVVAQALDMLEGCREAMATYLDTGGVQFLVGDQLIEGGFGWSCKLYRHAAEGGPAPAE
jgi:hypothetical protein